MKGWVCSRQYRHPGLAVAASLSREKTTIPLAPLRTAAAPLIGDVLLRARDRRAVHPAFSVTNGPIRCETARRRRARGEQSRAQSGPTDPDKPLTPRSSGERTASGEPPRYPPAEVNVAGRGQAPGDKSPARVEPPTPGGRGGQDEDGCFQLGSLVCRGPWRKPNGRGNDGMPHLPFT